MRRYGPLAAIVAVVAIIGVVLVVSSGDGDDTASDDTAASTSGTESDGADTSDTAETADSTDTADATDTGETGTTADPSVDTGPWGDTTLADLHEGVVPWRVAAAEGVSDQYEWGDRCDTETGTLLMAGVAPSECFAMFEGDNGGATEVGVTGDTVRIVLYQGPEDDVILRSIYDQIGNDDTNAQSAETVQAFADYYQAYLETYGRTLEVIPYVGTGSAVDATAARADAAAIAEDLQPFMVFGGPVLTPAFGEELATREVPCFACTPVQNDRFYEENFPYVWQIAKSSEQGQQHTAPYIGKRLAGRNAIHAGDEAFHDQERVFGTIRVLAGPDSEYTHEQFVDRLAEYDVTLAEDQTFADPVIDLAGKAATIIAKMKEAGVTSVIYAGDPLAPQLLTAEATKQDYFPEWILTGSALVDTTIFARTYDQEQWSNAFGVSNLVARQPKEQAGAYFVHECFTGEPPAADQSASVLIAGPAVAFPLMQQIGPDLTRQGMFDVLSDVAPINADYITTYQISFGEQGIFDSFDMAAFDDATEIWWDAETVGPDELAQEAPGMYQYVDGGVRYLPAEWPDTDPKAFDPDGAIAIYDTPPPGEEATCHQPGGPDGP
jgi:hypothetical protein